MDLEHLNKAQIILLTLLVSFVTSIATGIVTVSLVNQAPPAVTATVNRIIERTVEKVVTAPATQAAVPAGVKTVVVKDDDLIAQSIATIRGSIIRIVTKGNPDFLVARGLIIDAKGVAITDRGSIDTNLSYEAYLPSGERVPLTVRPAATSSPTALIDLTLSTTTASLSAAIFGDPAKLQLGQTVVRVGGKGADAVGIGVVAVLPPKNDPSPSVEATIISNTPGALLMTIFGEVVGITTTDSLALGSDFYSTPSIFKAAAGATGASNAAAAASAPGSSAR